METMETAKLKKNLKIFLKGFDALIRWFFRCTQIEADCKIVMETADVT